MGDALIVISLLLVGFAACIRYRLPIIRFLRNDGSNPVEGYKERRIKTLKRSIEDDNEELESLESGKEINNIPL